jgi:hypothetical protein
MSVEREVRWLVDGALGEDHGRALACQRLLLDVYLPWLQRRSVLGARRAGKDWAKIGRLVGRSRQAVRERFGTATTVRALLPPTMPADGGLRDERDLADMLAEIRRRREIDDAAATGSLVPW